MRQHKSQQGLALISAVLLSTVLLGIIFTLTAIFLPKIQVAREHKKSVVALYAAESGIEWCIYVINKGAADFPIMVNGAEILDILYNTPVAPADCADDPLKVLGRYQGVLRSFEIAF